MTQFSIPRRTLLAAAAVTAGLTAAPAWSDARPIATTGQGRVRGYLNQGIKVFKGIPYGADTAATRFLPPMAASSWTGVLDTVAFGPRAPQPPGRPSGFFPERPDEEPVGEDCLKLNVWTPGLADNRKRPVMVWFHGGGYVNFSANTDLYDGTRLCRKGDVVVVTLNHRLNLFGHLYLAEVSGGAWPDSGNVGMLDLILALEWVRDNIAAFGGDPGNVMIFGESGGGAKCATLMAMPRARGLFHKVATQSGQQITATRPETANAATTRVLEALNLTPDNLEPLKTLPMETLIRASSAARVYGPVRDGGVLPRDPFDPDAPPLSADIPMLMGNNHDETTLLIGLGDPETFELTWEALPEKIARHIGTFLGPLTPQDVVAKYRTLYPDRTPSQIFFAASTAFRSWRGQVIEADRRVAQPEGAAPTWVFQLDWKSPVQGGRLGAPHALDIPLVFDNVAVAPTMVGDAPQAQRMADLMSSAWLAFAHNSNPAAPSLPAWPAFDLDHRATMIFDLPSRVVDDPRGEERRFVAQVPYLQPGT